MTWYYWALIIIGTLGFMLQTIILSVTGTWAISKLKADIIGIVDEHKEEAAKKLAEAIEARDNQVASLEAKMGEMGHALRTKIHDFELFCRDQFVRRDSFMNLINEAKRAEERREAKYDGQLQNILDKIDDLRDRITSASKE